MTHLDADELKSWYEQGRASDRSRVIGHLADCEDCRRALSALAMSAEDSPIADPVVTTAEAVPLGYAARKAAPSPRAWPAWLRPAYGLSGAVLLVLGVVWLTAPGDRNPDGVVRSAELLALSPSGTTDAARFTWESPLEAANYRVTVRDARGALAFTLNSRASQVTAEPSMRERLVAGESYTWQVAALDTAGEVIAESRPATFRYQP